MTSISVVQRPPACPNSPLVMYAAKYITPEKVARAMDVIEEGFSSENDKVKILAADRWLHWAKILTEMAVDSEEASADFVSQTETYMEATVPLHDRMKAAMARLREDQQEMLLNAKRNHVLAEPQEKQNGSP